MVNRRILTGGLATILGVGSLVGCGDNSKDIQMRIDALERQNRGLQEQLDSVKKEKQQPLYNGERGEQSVQRPEGYKPGVGEAYNAGEVKTQKGSYVVGDTYQAEITARQIKDRKAFEEKYRADDAASNREASEFLRRVDEKNYEAIKKGEKTEVMQDVEKTFEVLNQLRKSAIEILQVFEEKESEEKD